MNKYFRIIFLISAVLFTAVISAASGNIPGNVKASQNNQNTQNIQNTDPAGIKDTVNKNSQGNPNDLQKEIPKELPIDTSATEKVETFIQQDTVIKTDSLITEEADENTLTNTKLFIYILLSVLGLSLFFFIFVINLFKTFHKRKSTRQSLLLSWNLFFIVSIIWLFIVWGIVAAFWTYPSFMIVMIFLFIISLIMTIIAVKSK